MSDNQLMNISVDLNESVIHRMVTHRVQVAMSNELDYAVRSAVRDSIGPYLREQITKVIASDGFQELIKRHIDNEVLNTLSPEKLEKLLLNKAFKAAVQSEAGKATHRANKVDQ